MEKELIFIGYSDFTSKKNDKHYNMLKFITEPEVSNDGKRADSEPISVFVEEDFKYQAFIKENALLTRVPVKVQINGTQVRYSI